MDANEIEEELHAILKLCRNSVIQSVECIAEEGVLEISFKVKDKGKLTLELESPWRILEDEQIQIGSGTLAICEEKDFAKVQRSLENTLIGASFVSYGFDDFSLDLRGKNGEPLKLQQFSDFVSEDPEDYNIAFHWKTEAGETHILVGPGSIYLTDAPL